MKYDFDRIIDRRGTGAIKTDVLKERYGREDLTALWVADMDFETPQFITEALKNGEKVQLVGLGTIEVKDVAELESVRNRLMSVRDVIGSRRGQN